MKTLKLLSSALLISTFISNNAWAGEPSSKSIMLKPTSTKAEGSSQNVIKVNLMALGMKSISLQYERAFHRKLSGAFGFNFMPSRDLPGFFGSDPMLSKTTLSGFSLTPELRFYPGKKEAPRGFYLAPYLRYGKFGTNIPVDALDPLTNRDRTFNFELKYGGFGGGLMIGSQWLIADVVSIDWWIIGGHYGSGTLSGSVSDPYFGLLSDAEKSQLEAEIKNEIIISGSSFVKDVNVDITNNSAKVSVKVPYSGIRSGLTIGYAF